MINLKDRMVQLVHHEAAENLADLVGEYVRAEPDQKEKIQAGIDFERWLAETCQDCLN